MNYSTFFSENANRYRKRVQRYEKYFTYANFIIHIFKLTIIFMCKLYISHVRIQSTALQSE